MPENPYGPGTIRTWTMRVFNVWVWLYYMVAVALKYFDFILEKRADLEEFQQKLQELEN